MSVQRKKHTHASKGRRRSHIKIKKQVLTTCRHCKEPKLPHHLCLNCQSR